MTSASWEHGSDQPLVAVDELLPAGDEQPVPWSADSLLVSTGRDAIVLLLDFGHTELGWKRAWLPSYYCQSVVRSIIHTGLDVLPYPSRPGAGARGLGSVAPLPGDVLVTLGHFGLYPTPVPPPELRASVLVVEDHSHDPWAPDSVGSRADYCFASLRKTLPLPDGAVLWSPARRLLPPPPPRTEDRAAAALDRLQAMALKAAYLAGRGTDKRLYRQLYASAEVRNRSGPPSAAIPYSAETLRRLPIRRWRRQRQENHAGFLTVLSELGGPTALRAEAAGAAPCFCVVVMASRAERDLVRARLAAQCVYAAAHWPLDAPAVDGLSPVDLALADRIITLQCDGRYSPADMRAVAELLSRATAEVRQ